MTKRETDTKGDKHKNIFSTARVASLQQTFSLLFLPSALLTACTHTAMAAEMYKLLDRGPEDVAMCSSSRNAFD